MTRERIFKSARGWLQEFRTFAIKGNALELAIAVVVGGAFSKIVSSLVADIITPTLALITGGADFKSLALTLRDATGVAPAVVLTYGTFLQSIFDFLIIAFSIFIVFKLFSAARRRMFVEEAAEEEKPQEKSAEERLLEEIRDLLKERR